MNNEDAEKTEILKPKKHYIMAGIYDWIDELAFAIILVVLLFSFVFRVVTVNGSSMEPNYYQNDRLIVTSIVNYVKQGDVIVIVDTLKNPIIKRVIATEGQTVDIDSSTGNVTVDGVIVDNTKWGVENGITFEPNATSLALDFPATVPKGCVFVLGDNRTVSEDSRYSAVGMVDERKIIGKALIFIYPSDKLGPCK
jgi:signal peptidase I